jgi:hypothetical protein
MYDAKRRIYVATFRFLKRGAYAFKISKLQTGITMRIRSAFGNRFLSFSQINLSLAYLFLRWRRGAGRALMSS